MSDLVKAYRVKYTVKHVWYAELAHMYFREHQAAIAFMQQVQRDACPMLEEVCMVLLNGYYFCIGPPVVLH